jgi:hypothetical protein
MQDENIPLTNVKAAYFQLMAAPADQVEVGDASVLQVYDAYLATVHDTGAKSTLVGRENTLFDFCFGLPSRFVKREGKVPPKPAKNDYIHSGFGKM